MKKILLIGILLLNYLVNAQNFSGKAYYNYSLKTAKNNNQGKSESEGLTFVKNILMNQSDKYYELNFNENESIYFEEVSLGRPNKSSFSFSSSTDKYYKDISKRIFIEQKEVFGKFFIIKDSLTNYQWELINETKRIGDFNCFKATTLIEINQGLGIVKDLIVVAWYTTKIPINQGPKEFWGLPGLILEIETEVNLITCTKIIVKKDKIENIKMPNKGEEVSKQEFNGIMKKKVNEIKEMYRGN